MGQFGGDFVQLPLPPTAGNVIAASGLDGIPELQSR